MDRRTYAIGILTLTATIMGTALLLTPSQAPAIPLGTVVSEKEYKMITASIQAGGDALYIIDNRRGLVAIMTYDNNSRSMTLRASVPISDAFAGIKVPAGK